MRSTYKACTLMYSVYIARPESYHIFLAKKKEIV
jgi:hypothetical protein